MKSGAGTYKLAEATGNIMEMLKRLVLQQPFPIDPLKFYTGVMPEIGGWLHNDGTRDRNIRYMLSESELVHFTAMDPDAYKVAVDADSVTYYDAVFWLKMPKPVIAYTDETCDAFNIPKDHFAYKEVMKWWEKQKEIEEFLNLTENRIDKLMESVSSSRELVVAFPELTPYCRIKLSAVPVSKRREAHLVEAKERIWPAPEASYLVEQLNTASLLPDVDSDELPYGLNWR